MKKLVAFFIVFILFHQGALANAKSQLEKVNNGTFYTSSSKQTLPDVKKIYEEKAVIDNSSITDNKTVKNSNNTKKSDVKKRNNSKMTNYQYDEANYHYDKVQKYIQNNLDYSQSGKMKY